MLFSNAMEFLLHHATTVQESIEMLENTNSNLWADPDIAQRSQNFLGNGYEAFFGALQEIQEIMLQIARELKNVPGVENLSRGGLRALISQHPPAKKDGRLQKFAFSESVKFTMKRRKMKESLVELKRCIEMVHDLQTKLDKLQPYRTPKPKVPVSEVQENAKKLYNALSRTWCENHSSHSAGLLLEARLPARGPKRGQRTQRSLSNVYQGSTNCFSLCLLQSTSSTSKKWLDVEVRLVESSSTRQQSA
jgi:hypothetical protein